MRASLPVKGKSGLAANDQLLRSIYSFRERKERQTEAGGQSIFLRQAL